MTNCHGRIGIEQQERHGTPDNVASADDDGALAARFHAVAVEKLHDAQGRAGDSAFLIACKSSDIFRGKPVHILLCGDTCENFVRIQLLGQRKLNEDAVHRIVRSERAHQFLCLRLRHVRGQVMRKGADPRFFTSPDLVADIDLRGGILADQHDRKSHLLTVFFFKCRRFAAQLRADLGGGLFSVDDRHLLMIPPNTPLTKSADFSVEYLRAIAVASETETTGGISSIYLISARAMSIAALSAA